MSSFQLSAKPVKRRPARTERVSRPRARARTIHELTERLSRAAASSTCALSESEMRSVIRAVRASSDAACRLGLLVLDVDELGLAAGEANLDTTGNLGVERQRDLAEEVEQPQLERRLERLRESLPGFLSCLAARQGGGVGEVLLKRLDIRCHLHDATMTSF